MEYHGGGSWYDAKGAQAFLDSQVSDAVQFLETVVDIFISDFQYTSERRQADVVTADHSIQH